jgi:hypothetical protein
MVAAGELRLKGGEFEFDLWIDRHPFRQTTLPARIEVSSSRICRLDI